MSARFTSCTTQIPGIPNPTEHGRKTRAESIANYRRHFEKQLAQAQTALAVPDEDLVVTTYLGSYAHRNPKVVTD